MLQCVDHRIWVATNSFSARFISFREVKKALFHMHASKAPGPEVMGAGFLQLHYNIVGSKVLWTQFASSFTWGISFEASTAPRYVLIPKFSVLWTRRNSAIQVSAIHLTTFFLQWLLPRILSVSQCAFYRVNNDFGPQIAPHYVKNIRYGWTFGFESWYEYGIWSTGVSVFRSYISCLKWILPRNRLWAAFLYSHLVV